MSRDLTVPELGENIETATVVEVLVSVGDSVALDQSVLSLETDKAEFEMPSTIAGTVAEILVRAGDEVRVGQTVARIGAGEALAAGTAVQQDEPETETEAAEAVSPQSDEEAPPQPAAASPGPPASEPTHQPPASAAEPASPASRGAVAAAPSVRRLAREVGIDIHAVRGSSPGGRITADDVLAHTRAALQTDSVAPPASDALPDFSKWGPVRIEQMSKIRRKTAENMARAWVEIPQVTQFDKADITDVDRLRRQFSARVKAEGGQLTWTAILLNVLGGALRRFRNFNTSVDLDNNAIVYKDYVHIGVAVDTDRGLLVPVIRDVDRKNIGQLAQELREVSDKARGRNIKPDMMQGATFTITNLGGIGGIGFSPIVNPPQVAILGVSRAATEPVYIDDRLEPRLMLPLSLSYDHRVIDGADAARFLRWVCEALQEPFLLELEGE